MFGFLFWKKNEQQAQQQTTHTRARTHTEDPTNKTIAFELLWLFEVMLFLQIEQILVLEFITFEWKMLVLVASNFINLWRNSQTSPY